MHEIYALRTGTLYGLLIGIIPSVGATTGLSSCLDLLVILLINLTWVSYFVWIWLRRTSTTGDTYTGVLLGIPGANSAAATMVDGFPLTQKVKRLML